jgi:replicative DNA helicase
MPYSEYAERTVLGAMMLEPMAVVDAMARLTDHDFLLDSHRRIFRAMQHLDGQGTEIDLTTLRQCLEDRHELDAVGGPGYLAYLTEGIPRHLHVESYAKIVKQKSQLREIISLADIARTRAMDPVDEDAESILADLQHDALGVLADNRTGGPYRMADVIPRVVERVHAQREHQGEVIGYTTGLRPLDRMTGGLRKNEMTILAADAGAGKTAMATQITIENALAGVPCMWFSLEMTKEQLVSRCFSSLSYNLQAGGYGPAIKATEMRDPRLISKDRMYDFYRVGDRLTELPILIDDDSGLDLNMMLARARLAIKRDKVEMIFVDYVQLMQFANDKLTEAQKIEKCIFALRDLAKTEPVHVIALSQYSYSEDGKRKRLKGSSSLRQATQNLLMLELEEEEGKFTGRAKVQADKLRDGAKGVITCGYDLSFLRFYEAA